MLETLVRFAMTQRLLVLLGAALLAALGWHAFRMTPIDAFPDVSTTQVKIIIKAPGLTPEEVETRITAPIEVEMLGIPRQTILRSTSKYALADITVDFEEGADIYWARQQVAERLADVRENLPPMIQGGIAPLTTPLGEMFMFTVEGSDLSLARRRELLDWVIRPALRTVPGVADVNALGGRVTTYEVVPDLARLASHNLGLEELAEALRRNNRNDGAGRLDDGEEVMFVRAEGAIQTLNDVASIIVRPHPTEPVRVSDVASVRLGELTRYGAVTRDGKGETVEGLVLGLRGANAREVVSGVRARLASIEPIMPKGVHINVFYDRGNLVDRAVSTVSHALGEAVVLVLVLLVIFLGDVRAALSVALILPLAALVTFILMNAFGMSANLMSLGGLAIAIGMLVDGAVVVVENVVSHLSRLEDGTRVPRLHVIYRATREVAVPVTSGILIIITVFLPLLTLQGLEGKLFTPVALTIIFALSASLLLSLTVIPVLASYLLGRASHGEPWLIRRIQPIYRTLLQAALAHPRIVSVSALILLAVAALTYTFIGKAFMPTMDEGSLIVQLEKLPSISLKGSLELDQRIQRALLAQVPEITSIVARTGSDELGLDPMGLNQTDSFLVLKPRDQWRQPNKEKLVDAIRGVLHSFPGADYAFTQPIEMRVSEMLTGVRGDVAVKIFGPDIGALNRTATAMVRTLGRIPGAEDVYTTRNEGAQYLKLTPDRLAAGRFGIDIDQLEDLLRMQVEGMNIGTVYRGIQRIPLVIRGPGDLRASPALFAGMRLTMPGGRSVPLTEMASLQRVEGPVQIQREQGNRMAVVIANVSGRDLVGFVEDARAAVARDISLPAGTRLVWGGQFENQRRAASRLAVVVPVAIGLIFLLLFFTFRSVRQSVLILMNIPLAMIGGVFALAGSGEYLSVPASVGFIALLGVAVLNGVVMVGHFNQLRALGKPTGEVVLDGAQRRLRPVLMTAGIAAFGLVPLLFASGPGSEIQRPLAIVVIGGLVSSTILTLFLLPLLYRRFGVARD